MNSWPNLFIVGAPKCGTSSVFAYLSQIDGIFMSHVKEPNFFSTTVVPEDGHSHPVRDEKRYLQLFDKAGDASFRGESSTTYLLDPVAPMEIAKRSPGAKIVVMLRDPVDLVFSFWLMMRRMDSGCDTLIDAVRTKLAKTESDWLISDLKLEFGFYTKSLKRYYEHFPAENIHVIIFEEFTRNPEATVIDLVRFLDVTYVPGSIEMRAYNQFGALRGPWAKYILGNKRILYIAEKLTTPAFRNLVRRNFLLKKIEKPELDAEAEDVLVSLFRDDVQRLQNFLSRHLPWPRFTLE